MNESCIFYFLKEKFTQLFILMFFAYVLRDWDCGEVHLNYFFLSLGAIQLVIDKWWLVNQNNPMGAMIVYMGRNWAFSYLDGWDISHIFIHLFWHFIVYPPWFWLNVRCFFFKKSMFMHCLFPFKWIVNIYQLKLKAKGAKI